MKLGDAGQGFEQKTSLMFEYLRLLLSQMAVSYTRNYFWGKAKC